MGSSHSSTAAAAGGGGICIESNDVAKRRRKGRSLSAGPLGAVMVASPESTNRSRLACGLDQIFSQGGVRRLQRRRKRGEGDGGSNGPDNNRSWLLADATHVESEAEADARGSVHSSYRLNFGSHMEAEEALGASMATPSSAVLLLVTLDDEGEEAGKGKRGLEERVHWRRLELLESSISSAARDLVRFSYTDVMSAARGFSKGRELERGELSRVYRGKIGLRRMTVAIKRVDGHGRDGAKAFCRELMIASSLRHANVVHLLGFCVDKRGLFLVYKYESGGSLDHHLHGHDQEKRKGKGKVLPWDVRYRVAIGVAQALEYMHHGTDKCVVHRDVKPSNILLSSRTPKICNFELATWTHGPSLPFLCKSVKGTFGYLAPEYFQHGKLSDKTDVYAYGVVLLELITGRKAIDQTRPEGEENLVLWAKSFMQNYGDALNFVDPRLKHGSYNSDEMRRMVLTAAVCLSSEESQRPSISQVLGMLQEEGTCNDWSVFIGNSCLTGYNSHSHELFRKSNSMKGHSVLAMLDVSDDEEDNMYRY